MILIFIPYHYLFCSHRSTAKKQRMTFLFLEICLFSKSPNEVSKQTHAQINAKNKQTQVQKLFRIYWKDFDDEKEEKVFFYCARQA